MRSVTEGVAIIATTLLLTACDDLSPKTGDVRLDCVDADSNPAQPVSFKDQIRPIMNGAVLGTKGCKSCHYAGQLTQEGFLETGLDLTTLDTLRRGGRETPPDQIVVPGKPCSSAIVKKLEGTFGDARMPKDGPYWNAAQIQLMIDWIAEGAKGDPTE